VRVLAGAGQLGPRTAEEARLAARLGWGDDIRLACQVRASGDVTVQRLIFDADDVGLLLGEQRKPTPAREMALAVMACGLMDFAVFARRFTPYDVVHVLNRFYLLAGEPVLSNGGTLQSYRDDGLVALFGLGGEEAKERCLKAVRAALRVAARMSELNAYLREHFGQELRLGVGLHFGRTIVGQIGHPSRLELSAIGGATSVAQRVRDLNRRRETCLLATEELVNVVEGDVSLGALLHDEESLDGRQLAVHEILDFNKRDAVLLVQESFEKVARRRAEAAALFYELLFQIDPGSRALFARTDMAVQGEMLMSVLAAAVKGLDRIEELRPTLLELGRRHVGYGVEPSHYASVEAALLEMVRRMSGEEFGIDVRLAWARIYSELTAVMLEGAADPAA
jgi:class 3 adenylate cyclase/hemoglobin-like flavoprotein